MNYIDQICSLGACVEGRLWLRKANHLALPEAWSACPRPDWMLWLLKKAEPLPSAKLLCLCACDIAETVLLHVPSEEDRPRIAIETARRWACEEATIEEVRAAGWAACIAARVGRVAGAAHTENAAYAAARAADAGYNVAAVSATIVCSVSANSFARATATHTFADYADIVRRHFPNPPKLPGDCK